MGLFRDEALTIFNDPDMASMCALSRKTSEATVDQDSESTTFGQIIPEIREEIIVTLIIEPYSVDNKKDSMVAEFLPKGYQINDLACLASIDQIMIGDRINYLGAVYEVLSAMPVTEPSNISLAVYYDCTIAKRGA